MVALALILSFLAAYAPALLGRWILLRVTEDVQATSIGGPMWRPVLYGTQVKLPGITAQAEQLGLGLAGFDLSRRVLYVNVDLRGAEVALELAELFGQGEDAITTEEGWKVQLRRVTVTDTALTVDSEGASVPDGTFQVTQARDGGLLAQGTTKDGGISAHLRFRQSGGGTEYLTNFQADARVLRHYWQGIEDGTITGEYRFGQGPVQGRMQLTGGQVRVPEADWAEVSSISGTATHTGDLIHVQLSGEGYGKPVTAVADVNLAAQQWKVQLQGTPQLPALAAALGTSGEGEARLTAQAHNLGPGWQGVEVVAQANSRTGTLAGIPFERLANEYRYLDRDGDSATRPEMNRWRLGADTALLGEQRLSGLWNFGSSGRINWRGTLLDAPLDLSAGIARETLEGRPADFATLAGTALGGPAQGRVALSGRVIEVRLNPELDSLSGALALSGRAGDLRLRAQGLNAAGFALDGEARFSEDGTVAQLRQPGGGTLSLNLDSDWRGEWQAQGLSGNGLTLAGRGGLDVNRSQLSGQLSLDSGLLERTLSGPLNLNWETQQARWDAGGQSLRWSGERLLADLNGLRLGSGIRLDGSLNASLGLDDLRGTLRGQGEGFSVTATGEGNRARWQGTLGEGTRSVGVSGVTRLDEGFATSANFSGADISADVRMQGGLRFDFDLRTADERASGVIDGENWDAQGRVNLSALRPVLSGVLGPDSPLADLSGTLDLNLRGRGGAARVQAQAAGAALAGTLQRQAGVVTATNLRASGGADGPLAGFVAVASGQVYPRVNLRGPVTLGNLGGVSGLSGQVLQGQVYGDYSRLNAALNGRTAPLSLSGVRLPAQQLSLGGRLTPTPDLSGRWGDLDLRYRAAGDGQLSVSGTQALTVQGRAATVRGRASWGQGWQGQADLSGVTADGYALAVRGPWNALRVTASHPDGLRAAGTVNAPRQSYDLAVSGRAQGFGVQGRVRGQGLNPTGDLTLTDSQGGRAFLTLNGLDNLTLRADALRLGGQTFSGNLRSVGGLADGQLTTTVSGQTLTLRATRGRVNVSGVVQDHRVQASGLLRLPGAGGALQLSGLQLNVNGPYLTARATGSLENLRGQVTLRAQQFGGGDAALIVPQQTLPLSASLSPLRATVGGLTYSGGRWSGNAALSYLVRTRGAQAQAIRGGQVQLSGTGAGLSALASGALAGRVALLPEIGGTLSADTALLRPLLPAELRDLQGGRVQATFTAAGARITTPGMRYQGQPLGLNARVDWRRGFSLDTLQASGVLANGGRSRLPFALSGGTLTLQDALLDVRDVRPFAPEPGRLPQTGTFRGNLRVTNLANFSLGSVQAQGVLASGRSRAPLSLYRGALRVTGGLLDVRDLKTLVDDPASLPQSGTFQGDLYVPDLNKFDLQHIRANGLLASGASRVPLDIRNDTLRVSGGVLNANDVRRWLDIELPQRATFRGDVTLRNLGDFAPENLRARGVLEAGNSRLPLTLAGRALTVTGGRLDLADVQPYLDLPARGVLRGDLFLPDILAPDLAGARADLVTDGLSATELDGTSAQGRLRVRGGQLWADLSGQVQGQPLTLRGDLYPRANATLQTGGVTARLSGRAEETLNFSAAGSYQGRAVDVQGTLDGLLAEGRAARAALSGTVSGSELDLTVQEAGREWQDWRVSGSLLVPDARTLDPELRGSLSGSVGGTLGHADVQVQGTVNDIALNVPATFSGGELRVHEAQATSAELGTATLSGLAFPRLNLSGAAQLSGDLAGHYDLSVSGDYSAPTARLNGQLAGAPGSVHPSGLNIGGTGVQATLQEGRWQAQLSGPAVRGTVSGMLGAQVAGQDTPLGLERADLNLNARYRQGEDDFSLSGPLAWTGSAGTNGGWRGNLTVRGTLGGEQLSAQATGVGPLSVTARLGDASLRAELGRLAPVRPEGWVALDRWDIGALWGRPEQLRLTGRADLAGPSWQSVQARLNGQLDDVTGELSGTLSGQWNQAQGGTFALSGPRVQASGTLRDGMYDVDARLGDGPQGAQVGLARLLPAGWGVTALKASGHLSVRGRTSSGLERLDADGLEVSGEQVEAGPFTLYGRASYRPQQGGLDAALAGGYGGGIFRIGGSLPRGLNVQVANVSLAQFASEDLDLGRLNGEATLQGPLDRAALSGAFWTAGGNADAAVNLLGRLDDPRVEARLNLRGNPNQRSGELTLSARDFDLTRRTFLGEVRGQVRQGDTVADLDLRGPWPKLGGQVRVQAPSLKQPVTLRGQNGEFVLDPGVEGAGSGTVTLSPGAGWLPKLNAQADLNPLALLPGASGEARLRLNAGGELSALTVQGTLNAPEASVAGVTVRDVSGTFGGTLQDGLPGLSGELTQRGQKVGQLAGSRLTLSGLSAETAGSTLALSGPMDLSSLSADLTADVSGSLSGGLRLNYAEGRLGSTGTLQGLGYRAALDIEGSQESGWSGTVTARDTEGAPEVLTTPASLSLSGPWEAPRLSGSLGLLDTAATLNASADGAVLTLADGVTAKGSGELRVAPDPAGVWRWTGAASIDSPRMRLSLTPRGELADPVLGVAAGRGSWQAIGSVSREAGHLNVSDGERSGSLDWQGERLTADLSGLDLAGLRWRGLAGHLSAQGTVDLGATGTASSALPFRIDGLRSPWRVDALNLPLSGDVSGTLTLQEGRPAVQAQATLGSEGTAQGQASLSAEQQPGGEWFGRVQGRLQQEGGTLSADVRSDAAGLSGQVQASGYPVKLQDQTLALSGAAVLGGQTFTTDLTLGGVAGEATLSGGGSLGAALPALSGLTAVQDTGSGYDLSGTLNRVDLGSLELVPDLSGVVSGELDITDGAGQFVLRSADLNLAGEALPSRFEGVLVGQDWRIRGYLGDTDVFAGVSGGVLSGNAELQGLPVGAVANALAGQRLADGRVTGVARFEAPLADPLSGRATVVAERIRLTTLPGEEGSETAQSETLTGSGSLDFGDRELRGINVQLGGAGSWDIRGQYTRERVDVRANFTETTFTPLLALIPSLAEQNPRLQGSLNVAVLGDYGQPVGTLEARNLRGSLAGVSLSVPALSGRLDQSGRWTLGGGVRTGGALDSAGTVQGTGLWRNWQLSESALNYSGQLSPGKAVGTLSGVQASLSQSRADPERWVLDARSVSRNATTGQGTLEVRGQLIPAWDLSVRASNYDLALPGVFLRESALNGALTLRQDAGSEDIRVSGSADFARAVLGRPDTADDLDALVPGPEQTPAGSTAPDNFVSPLPQQYTTFPEPAAEAGSASAEPPRPALPLLERLILEDIPVRFSGGIQLQESLAQAELGGALRLSGTGDRPQIAGNLSGQRGTLLLRDTEFNLRQLDVNFSGTSPYPAFTLLAEGRVRPLTGGAAVPITLDVQGNFIEDGAGQASLDLKTALRCTDQTAACSDPRTGQPYTESQLYALVLTGVPNVENLPENLGTLGASALNTALNVFVLGELSRNLADALGVDVLRFTPVLVGEGGATITIGSQLTENLYLEYQVDLTGEGLIDATYNTPDGRFTFKVTTPFDFGESRGFRPSVSTAYNINDRTSFTFNIENGTETNRFSVGVLYRLPSNFWRR
ncbi:hypothetical protein GCM10017783_00070 [Deinococcus piscis]|uniref:Translocation and assembly module TamB C-terminal domain-containing protein n=1 Tax=Deinococcus piscis TaxID=394230 RepID=A0ABQ3JWI7_9DEIO|nr:hypothetical protein GCM10017783_00070 [Deinococcus piscis]